MCPCAFVPKNICMAYQKYLNGADRIHEWRKSAYLWRNRSRYTLRVSAVPDWNSRIRNEADDPYRTLWNFMESYCSCPGQTGRLQMINLKKSG